MSAKPTRPASLTIAAVLHFAIALAFASIPIIGLLYGTDVQAAAEAEVVRQARTRTSWPQTGSRSTSTESRSGRRSR
jgi:hypothetical protein